jgi:membrane protease YdiL (CAAX protease family)
MKNKDANFFRKYPVAAYYILAIIFSWMIELPLVAIRQGWVEWQMPFSVHYLAAFGPMLAALTVTATTSGRAGLAELWSRITRWRVDWKWGLISISSPLLIFLLGLPLVWLVKGVWPDLSLLGQANYLPNLGIGAIVLWVATFGFGEEIGWRGFALPHLQRRMSVSKATLILGLMWILWHMPALFYLETYQGFNPVILPGLLLTVLFGAVIFTWIYNGTRGSILMVALWHGLFDFFTASKAGQDIIPILMSVFVILIALIVANTEQPWGFRQLQKHVVGGDV